MLMSWTTSSTSQVMESSCTDCFATRTSVWFTSLAPQSMSHSYYYCYYYYMCRVWCRTLVYLLAGLDCEIDIQKTVEEARTSRSGMVQTEAQYKFIYDVIKHYIETQKARFVEQVTHITYCLALIWSSFAPISWLAFNSQKWPIWLLLLITE